MKIYCLSATVKDLRTENGDVINEVKFYNALNEIGDVYYSNVPLKHALETPLHKISPPNQDYDFYYIRNNYPIFNTIKGVKACMAYPYNKAAFEQADYVFTTTEAWKTGLLNYNQNPSYYQKYFCHWYPEEIATPKKIINIRQIVSSEYQPLRQTHKSFLLRARFGFGTVFSYFGRLEESTYPHIFLSAYPKLKLILPDMKLIFAGKIRDLSIPSKYVRSIIYEGVLPHSVMPYAVSASDFALCNEEPAADWLGAGKVLEAMACGVLPITYRHKARAEQLGDDYPLFYESENDLIEIFNFINKNPVAIEELKQKVQDLAQNFCLEKFSS